jgi:hypothetical protein
MYCHTTSGNGGVAQFILGLAVILSIWGILPIICEAACTDLEFAANARVSPFHVKPLAIVTFCPNLRASRRNKLGFSPLDPPSR